MLCYVLEKYNPWFSLFYCENFVSEHVLENRGDESFRGKHGELNKEAGVVETGRCLQSCHLVMVH